MLSSLANDTTAGPVATPRAGGMWLHGAAVVVLAAGCLALFAYLLWRYPFDGLYGQDSYAYYHESAALLDELRGQPSVPGALFTAGSLGHWPVGYHLLLMLGLLLDKGPTGGRALTVLTGLGSVALVYLVALELFPGLRVWARAVAGLAAGLGLMLAAIFPRTALSIMSDVPALCWSLLAVYCCLHVRPPPVPGEAPRIRAHARAWEVACGLGLGFAVLTRYGSILLAVALLVYLVARRFRLRALGQADIANSPLVPPWALAGFAAALVPQAFYLAAHPSAGIAYQSWLAGWSPSNLLATTVSGADGTMHFAHSMLAFYLLDPLRDSTIGFLPALYLPAFVLGACRLVAARWWPQLALLASWWLCPVAFFSGTQYQAHRFVLGYLPALLLVFGVGIYTAVELGIGGLAGAGLPRLVVGAVSAGVLVCAVLGALQEPAADRTALAAYHGLKVEEQQVVTLAEHAVSENPSARPRAVSFGITAALYHYTGWPVAELYNEDAAGLERFMGGPGPALVVVPVGSLNTQWTGTPLAAGWRWLQNYYRLSPQGVAGEYTVFRVEDPR